MSTTKTVQRSSGTVKMWNDQRGFGFLKVDGGDDTFCHISQVVDGEALHAGPRVSFLIDKGRDGRPIARQVLVTD
jgi:cold shock protein